MRIVGGQHKGRKLFIPSNNTTRPTADLVKSSLFNILQNEIFGKNVLDLFAGSGSLGLEALSRGASFACFVEKDRECYNILRKNCDMITGDKLVLNLDYTVALKTLNQKGKKFDLIFLDPPYNSNLEILALEKMQELKILNNEAIIVIEQDLRVVLDFEKFSNYENFDTRKYGRKKLYFLRYKE